MSSSIAAKELFPILVAVAIWGGSTVRFYCDNTAEVLNRQAAKDPLICHQLRSLFYISARFDLDIVARHTPGVAHVAADAISRNNIPIFGSQVLGASFFPAPVPPELATGLSAPSPAWRSRDWTSWLG